jgi:hypothetical protein
MRRRDEPGPRDERDRHGEEEAVELVEETARGTEEA